MARKTGRSGQLSGSSRRDLLKAGAVLAAAAPTLPGTAAAQGLGRADARAVDRLVRQSGDPNRRILVRGGTIVSMDPRSAISRKGDMLIEGKKIVARGAAATRSVRARR